LYVSPNIMMIKSRNRWGTDHEWEIQEMHTKFVRKPKGKRTLGRPRHKWEHNIQIDLRKTGWEVMDWTHLAQVREQ